MTPQRPRLQSSSSFSSTSSLNLSAVASPQESKRSYLFIFVILWFSSLQIVLFTWNQIPAVMLPMGILPGSDPAAVPNRRRRLAGTTTLESSAALTAISLSNSSSSGSQSQCARFQSTQYQQSCHLLHQIWDTIPDPWNPSETAERRVYPNALVRQPLNNSTTTTTTTPSSAASETTTTAIKNADTVVLATHLGVKKLDILLIQARWWGGPVSAAVLVQDETSIDMALSFIQSHADELQQVSFHFVLEKTNLPYPHNVLRNLALEYLDADFFVAADVDFIPSWGAQAGLDALLHAPASAVRSALLNSVLLVLPAFERFQDDPGQDTVTEDMLPRTKADLQELFKEKSLIGFHMAGSPMGHGPTDFPKWLKNKTDDYYGIEYKNVFEPYVMGYRPGLPRYWEDFRGYGYNKFSWYMELHRACYEFGVLRDYFMVHMNHPMVDRTVKHDQTEANRDSWKQFKSYLNGRYKQTCPEIPARLRRVDRLLSQ